MNAAWQEFHFLRPGCLWLGLLLPLLVWLSARRSGALAALRRIVDAQLLPGLLEGRPARRGGVVALVLAGWTLAVLALAGPVWNRTPQPLYASRAGQVVAFSLSSHMLIRDVVPSRLDLARYKVQRLLDGNRDGLNALLAYAGESYVVAPLTTDAGSISALLQALTPDEMPVDGNDDAAAIRQAVELLQQAKVKQGSIVLVTDSADAQALKAAQFARGQGMQVSVLGIGSLQPSPIPDPQGGFQHDAQGGLTRAPRDDAALAALARAGGGVYRVASAGDSDLQALHGVLHPSRSSTQKAAYGDLWQERGPWLLLPLLLIAAAGFRRGWLVLPFVLLPMFPAPAQAMGWNDLWQRPDQQAAKALRSGQPKAAQRLAQDPALRGAAAYRAGDYAAAQQALEHAPGSDGAYNLGNALAKQQSYQAALKAYDQAIKLDPHNLDAIANRKAVADWLRRQQPPQDSPKKDQQKNNRQNQPQKNQQSQDKHPSSSKQSPADKRSKPTPGQGKSPSQPPSPAHDSSKQPSDQHGAPRPGAAGQNKPPGEPGQGGAKAPPGDTRNTPADRAAQAEQARRAQQALQQQMNQALAGKPGAKPAESSHQLGTDDGQVPALPEDLKQQLLRVPDDPGALLRRKFQLEYQQRHAGAADDGGEGP